MREFMAVAKAMADENRVRALMLLRGGELCLCQIIEILGLAPSTVSKHMAVLHQARLVETRKEGRWIYYRRAGAGASPAVRAAIRGLRACLDGDSRVAGDDKRRRRVCKMSKEDLCSCYKG
jgi:ArsR family transcriptional regulator, arsenate/arsenite/antimonite-responsive transcriptional repressor